MDLRPHPCTRVAVLPLLALMVQGMPAIWVAVTALLCTLACSRWAYAEWRRMLRRSRWLILVLILVYAWNTPGEYIAGIPLSIAPTYEGLQLGVLQLGKLFIMLSSIALLLASTPREQLIAGIFVLLQPLRCFGLSPAQCAARLWLTLHYVERAPSARITWANLPQHFADLPLPADTDMRPFTLHIPRWSWLDITLLLSLCGLTWKIWS